MKEIAENFGIALDQDAFDQAKEFLSEECKYYIGNETLTGPDAICASYEQNMIEGRKKLDSLVWGDSYVESISENEYYIHYTDFLTHQGKRHIFSCKQRLKINSSGKIYYIEHVNDPEEEKKLDLFYKKVGLK